VNKIGLSHLVFPHPKVISPSISMRIASLQSMGAFLKSFLAEAENRVCPCSSLVK